MSIHGDALPRVIRLVLLNPYVQLLALRLPRALRRRETLLRRSVSVSFTFTKSFTRWLLDISYDYKMHFWFLKLFGNTSGGITTRSS